MNGTVIKGTWPWYHQPMAMMKMRPSAPDGRASFLTKPPGSFRAGKVHSWVGASDRKSDDTVVDVSKNVLWPQWWYRRRPRLPSPLPPHSLVRLWTQPSLEPQKCSALFFSVMWGGEHRGVAGLKPVIYGIHCQCRLSHKTMSESSYVRNGPGMPGNSSNILQIIAGSVKL